MLRTKFYENGNEQNLGDGSRAKSLLSEQGLLRTYGNLGPLSPDKLKSMQCTVLRRFQIEDMEFTEIEIECMYFGFSGGMSEPNLEKWCYYQTTKI